MGKASEKWLMNKIVLGLTTSTPNPGARTKVPSSNHKSKYTARFSF
jgi:hypothetical protein